jgi:hypothetical protein
MRALTLTQPWCGLVASGIKLIENRAYPIIRNEVAGEHPRFALHASRKVDTSVVGRVREIAPEIFGNDMEMTDDEFFSHVPDWIRLGAITSAVIGVATIDDVWYIGGCSRAHIDALCTKRGLESQARWTFGPTCYVLRDVRELATPVPCRGYQGFWTLPVDIEDRVIEQLAERGR